jgi:hypothetical protein
MVKGISKTPNTKKLFLYIKNNIAKKQKLAAKTDGGTYLNLKQN